MLSRRFVTVSAEILKAVRNGDPVVALESTIITHGMPWPKNNDMALKVEKIFRDKKVVPATIGIVGGHIFVGMSRDQMSELAQHTSQPGKQPLIKVSRRDLSYVIARKLSGGTTVAATMMLSHKAGIPIFVTGGIGGVHRGAETTFDVSADLTELGRTPVSVVSAGVKSILDIGKTLEYLETQGVSVASFGSGGEFPAFFSSKSGFKAPFHVRTPEEAAQMIHVNQVLQTKSGMLFAVPVPEEFSADGDKIEAHIQAALKECDERGIVGKDITPFVLAKLNEITKGASLKANLALIENNARVGADIALELARIGSENSFGTVGSPTMMTMSTSSTQPSASGPSRPVIVGGSNFDFVCRVTEPSLRLDGTTHFGNIRSCFGGVGRNIAEVLASLDTNPFFISSVGNDPLGQSILRHNEKLDKSGIAVNSNPTSAYCVVLDFKGQARIGIGDINQVISPQQVEKHIPIIRKSPILILDANLGMDTINFVLEECQNSKIPVFFEPTDKNKGLAILKSPHKGALTYASPNLAELRALAGAADRADDDDGRNLNELLQECIDLSVSILDTIPFLVVTLGDRGVLVVRRGLDTDPLPLRNASNLRKIKTYSAKHYPVQPIEPISVVGAGDCFTGAFISGLMRGCDQDMAVSVGIQAARLSLVNEKTVPYDLSSDKIHWEKIISNGRRIA